MNDEQAYAVIGGRGTMTVFDNTSGENLEVDPPRRLVQSFTALWSD
jgi:hypothetical protein